MKARLLTLTTLALVVLAAPASAVTTLSVRHYAGDEDYLVVKGDAAASRLALGLALRPDGAYTVTATDRSAPVRAGKGCRSAGADTVRCVTRVAQTDDSTLGGGNDRFTATATAPAPPGATKSPEWRGLDIEGGPGDDRMTTAALTARAPDRRYEDSYLRLSGGTGRDTLVGGPAGDALNGDDGADRIGGGAGDDELQAGTGKDVAQGGAGNDTLYGDTAAARLEGGAGDDAFPGLTPGAEPDCGEGLDRVSPYPGDPAPGPLLGTGCEELLDFPGVPVARTADTLTFGVGCTDFVGGCRARLLLRLDGELLSDVPFRARGDEDFASVPVPVHPDLRTALAAGPATVQMTVMRYATSDADDVDVVRRPYHWRVRLPQG